MIEESGPLSASYQIHHSVTRTAKKPVARCHISELELDHGSLALLVLIFSMLSSLLFFFSWFTTSKITGKHTFGLVRLFL